MNKKNTKSVKSVKKERKKREPTVKVPLFEVPNVIDQTIHINQTPEQMVPPKPVRGPKKKREVKIMDGRKIGPVHPVRSGFGEPVGMVLGKRVDFAKDGTVLSIVEQAAGTTLDKDGKSIPTPEVAYSKVYIGASRVNLNSGDKFNAAEGRALCLAQIEEMVAGNVNQVAESLIPYIRPFRDRCIRYFTRKHSRAPIDVVTPIGRSFKQKVSYEAKQDAIRFAEYENAKRQYVSKLAAQHMSPEELAQKEVEFREIWLAKGRKLPVPIVPPVPAEAAS